MAYHKNKITKGVLGEFSKITEEYEELKDAVEQNNNVLIICELTDLIGSIESYIERFNLSIDDLKKFSDLTKESFQEGKRK